MSPVDTRLLRPIYFRNLYAFWTSSTDNRAGISMQPIEENLPLGQPHIERPIDLINGDNATSQRPGYALAGSKRPRQRVHSSHQRCCQTTCMDRREAKGNAPIAPMTQSAKTKFKSKSTPKPRCNDNNEKEAPMSDGTPARVINASDRHATVHALKKDAPHAQPRMKKQRRIKECWADANQSVPVQKEAAGPSQILPECPTNSFGLKILCWNVMGLTTVGEEFEQLLRQHDPDIIILTETKLTDRTQRKCCLNGILKTHWLQFSSSPHSSLSNGERQGSGGLAVAVRKSLVPHGCYERLPIQKQHRSHLLQVLLQPPNSTTVLLQAVYMPFDHATRASIYEAVKEACKGRHSIVAGDMNAALYTRDRNNTNMSALDKDHGVFMAQNVLAPTDSLHRPFSHTVRSLDSTRDIQRSRIDDILVTPGIKRHLPAPCTEVLQATDDSDHLPLLSTLDVGKVGFVPPLDLTSS